MLKEKILKNLNEQITAEHYASNLYLSMSSWCTAKGLDGAARFLNLHSREELEHMHRLINYVNETGSQAIIDAIPAPPNSFKDIRDIFEQTFKHEVHITNMINKLVELTLAEKDFSSFNFLQWYVAEQHEEEALFKGILDKIEVIGLDGRGLYMLDQEIAKLCNTKQ